MYQQSYGAGIIMSTLTMRKLKLSNFSQITQLEIGGARVKWRVISLYHQSSHVQFTSRFLTVLITMILNYYFYGF